MKQILVLGATGGIGHWVTKLLTETTDHQVSAYVRTPKKLDDSLRAQMEVLQGDVLDTEKLSAVMEGKDIVVAALSGDWLGQAKSIAAAMKGKHISHVYWVTGLGIHREVPGETGKILEYYVNRYPEYIEAAEVIANMGIPYTLVRAANLMNGNNMNYYVQMEGEPVHAETVDRCAVAKFIVDSIEGKNGGSTCASCGEREDTQMENFNYCIGVNVLFGKDQIENLPSAIKPYGSRILLVYGGGSIKKIGIYDKIRVLLKDCQLFELSGISPNPKVDSVRAGVKLCREIGSMQFWLWAAEASLTARKRLRQRSIMTVTRGI